MKRADSLRTGRPFESCPPAYAGCSALGRGLADHATRGADHLLVWYRTLGAERGLAVQLYLARRAIAADWPIATWQAAAIIESAMRHVATRRPNADAMRTHMRKEAFLEYRAQASAWLRAGIMEAVWRYELTHGD